MSHQPIIVGVDGSAESRSAAGFAATLAAAAHTTFRVVHAVRDVWFSGIPAEIAVQASTFTRALQDDARARLLKTFEAQLPHDGPDSLIVDVGAAAVVLNEAAERLNAQLIVLGGKHHSTLGRWLSGSTSLNVARTASVPVLVTAGQPAGIKRVLVSVDASEAAGPTLDLARRYADWFGAELRVLSVLEPLPVLPEGFGTAMDTEQYYGLCREMLQQELAPKLEHVGGALLLRYGGAVDTILREATVWPADLLVMGSHGKSWARRLMLGSVTESILNYLPTSVLIAPVRAAHRVPEPSLAMAGTGQA
jgi:nucleotide-binding universal stress UspA family protein